MKVHKTTSDRIFFITDTGAYGSILKSDVQILVDAIDIPEIKLDAREGKCAVSLYKENQFQGNE